MDDAIDHLNALAADSGRDQTPMRTTEQLREFFKNPPKRPYSVPLEEALTSVVKMFAMADENARREIASRLTPSARNRLLGYAADMAVLAVRRQSPALIEQGLIAIAIENASRDWRDSIAAMAKLYHSASKLGMNAEEAFEQAAGFAEPGTIQTEMRGFPRRHPKDRDLRAFYQTVEMSDDGFCYKQILPGR